ncbi:MAG TPA: 3-deoxy-7-phosphoheptulonate synthase [Candidatus Latescibacteria bacterium]|nr:3-deoxy-7-phosphoheptulonate synthase [Candidatus Handelsmanbacteria bacterium]HIL07150.1 3-deoxy-7-phosphoheptulonate synthase [Candidatus Latescibacterota bacterium]
MFESTDDLRIAQLRPLIPPAILMEELPLSEKASQTVAATRRTLDAILTEEDDRLAVVVGPCSIHDPEAALEYGRLLLEKATALSGELCIIMRVYFEKPRTTVGWKGLINDPHLDGSFDINNGLRMARGLLAKLADMGLPAGSEYLDTISPQFIADLICWGAIGARTTESQIHRELASGLSMPVGFKNGTDGNVQIALDAIGAACHPHHFLSVTKQGISAIVETTGNVHCHLILRGGSQGTNYDAASVGAAADKLRAAELPDRIMVDCSHGNSDKDHKRQPAVARDVAQQVAAGARDIFGVMLESHLVEGNQKQTAGSELVYGQSITDACIGWEETAAVLEELAAAVATRRKG